MADRPIESLGGRTPLEYAKTPKMDELAAKGEIGMVHTIPDGMKPGSDTANLSVLGYNPREFYSGRSPLEALSIGVPMKDTDVALRCNIVTLSEEEDNYEDRTIIDHSSGEISTEECAVLLEAVKKELETDKLPPLSDLGERRGGGSGAAARCAGTEDRRQASGERSASHHDEEKL